MRLNKFKTDNLRNLFHKRTIATLPELMTALGTGSRRTVFRKLMELDHRTSYSHRGKYYTLNSLVDFDERGLWTFRDIWFSVHGTLLTTATAFVEFCKEGYFVDELDNVLHVSTKDALRKLVNDGLLTREHFQGKFLYLAADKDRGNRQIFARRALLVDPGIVGPIQREDLMPDELRAAIVLFYSLLDEKLRRLYAGLEALKVGHGGDARIAALLGLEVTTVARGRRELMVQDVEVDRVRRKGGGRHSIKKKHPKSSRGLKSS